MWGAGVWPASYRGAGILPAGNGLTIGLISRFGRRLFFFKNLSRHPVTWGCLPFGCGAECTLVIIVQRTPSRAYVMPSDLSEDLRRFISEHLGSIVQLELLLLLSADGNKAWSADEVAKALYISPEAALGFLEGLRGQGLCQLSANTPQHYQFAPAKPEWEQLTRELAAMYKERRVTIINLIYAGPVQKFQSFADAFRLRKDK